MIKNTYNTVIFESSEENEPVLRALQSFIETYRNQISRNKNIYIPVDLFSNRRLGILEIVVKYLKENHFLSYAEIAKLTGRNPRTIWTTYNNVQRKYRDSFDEKETEIMIPCSIFVNRTQGPLEALVCYLKDNCEMNCKQISLALNRNYNTVWLSYKNGKKHEQKQ